MPMSMRRVTVLFPDSLYEKLDEARGDVTVSTFLRRLVEDAVGVKPLEVKRGRAELRYDYEGGQGAYFDAS